MKELTRRKPKTPQILEELKEFSDEYIENVVQIQKKNQNFLIYLFEKSRNTTNQFWAQVTSKMRIAQLQ